MAFTGYAPRRNFGKSLRPEMPRFFLRTRRTETAKANPSAVMIKRCELYWNRFVASQINAQKSRSEAEKIVWLQVAEKWLTMAHAENLFDRTAYLSGTIRKRGPNSLPFPTFDF